jgi:hypothetical protein
MFSLLVLRNEFCSFSLSEFCSCCYISACLSHYVGLLYQFIFVCVSVTFLCVSVSFFIFFFVYV